MIATTLLLPLLLSTGCGGGQLQDRSLVGVVPSAMLAPYLDASFAHLATQDTGDSEVRRDLQTYDALQQRLYDSNLRVAAVESLFALWQAHPTHVLWPELAMRNRHLLGTGDRRAEMFAHPACSDSSTAIGAYMLGWKLRSITGYTRQFRDARNKSSQLEDFPAIWIDLKAAYGERLGGDPQRSVQILLETLASAGEMGGRRLEALVWVEIARAMLADGELDDALYSAVMADTLMASSIAPGGAISGLLQIRETKADVLAARRDTQLSLAVYEDNVKTASELNLAYLASRNLNRASVLAEVVGDRDLGIRYSQQGLGFAISDHDSLAVPRHLMNIARRFRMRGDLDSCRVYQEQAVDWVAMYPHPQNVARMPLMQAEYHAQVGEYSIVDSLLNAAASLSQKNTTLEARAELHLELIRGWMETDRPDLVYRSIEALEELNTTAGDIFADRHVSADLDLLVGEFLTQRSEFVRAAESLDRAALALQSRPNLSRSWTLARNRGVLARQRAQLTTAKGEFQSCIDIGLELETPELVSTGRFLLGSVLLEEGRYAEARATFPSVDPEDFRGRFITRVSVLLFVGISHAREGNQPLALEAFDVARNACRSWSPLALTARIDLEEGRAHAAAKRFDEARKLYEKVAGQLEASGGNGSGDGDEAAPELAYFNGNLRRDCVESLVALPTMDPAASLAVARKILPRWRSASRRRLEAMASPQLIFFVGRDLSGRWSVIGERVQWTALPGERDLNPILAAVLADMSVPGRSIAAGDVERLVGVLLRDLPKSSPNGKTMKIVPDLALFGVPWSALHLPGESQSLIDRGPLAILDQPAPVSHVDRLHHREGRLLAVGANGNAAVQSAGLKTLHNAEREARDIAAAWPRDQTTLRVGAAAAKALLRDPSLASYEAIHVASHALVLRGRPERSMLLLAGEQQEALTAHAIRALDLDAAFVFLSSCEVGGGRDLRSEYAGLAQSFLDAGAHAVVAPLIAVDDEAARAIAARYYVHWLAGHSVPAALRAAQLDLRDGGGPWAHPFYWAFYQPIVAAVP